MSSWHDISALEHLWSEDEVLLHDPDAERLPSAWQRLLGEAYPGTDAVLERHDGGDCTLLRYPNGRVVVASYDGHHLYAPLASIHPDFRPSAEVGRSAATDDPSAAKEDPSAVAGSSQSPIAAPGSSAASPLSTSALDGMSPDQSEGLQKLLDGIAAGERVLVLKGAAGTGKTWLMRKLAESLLELGWRLRYLAPTGKAAHRLSEAVGASAQTIHSAMFKKVIDNDAGDPVFLDPQPLAETRTVIICDEASMVDEFLDSTILANLPNGCVLVYVGDPEQLEPVYGKWGPDFANPTAELTTVHRQALDNPIYRVATDLRGGGKLPVNNVGIAYLYQRGRLGDAAAWLIQKREEDADAVCLTYTNKARNGINILVRQQLGFAGGPKIMPGERLVVLFNNRRAGKMNGETFDVESVTNVHGAMRLRTSKGSVFYTHPDLVGADLKAFRAMKAKYATKTDTRLWVHIDYGYCLTVHKSQGSEFAHVMFVMTGTMRWMIGKRRMTPASARRLCYTALTRAKTTFTRLDA